MKKQNNTSSAQRHRLLKRLQKRPCTTMEARHELDILSPPARVYELRHKFGYNIQTESTYGENPGGGLHRIGKYVLLSGKWQGDAHE